MAPYVPHTLFDEIIRVYQLKKELLFLSTMCL